MTVRSALHVTFACEFSAGERPCPVRFSWLGPARDAHTRETETADSKDALDRAEDLGWWFGKTVVACPRHAAKIDEGDSHGAART